MVDVDLSGFLIAEIGAGLSSSRLEAGDILSSEISNIFGDVNSTSSFPESSELISSVC